MGLRLILVLSKKKIEFVRRHPYVLLSPAPMALEAAGAPEATRAINQSSKRRRDKTQAGRGSSHFRDGENSGGPSGCLQRIAIFRVSGVIDPCFRGHWSLFPGSLVPPYPDGTKGGPSDSLS